MILLHQYIHHLFLSLLGSYTLEQLFCLVVLPTYSEIQIPIKEFIITFLYLRLILHSFFTLLKTFLMNLYEIIYSFFAFGVSSSEMGTGEANSSLVYFYSETDGSFVAELSSHTSFYCIFLYCFDSVFPRITNEDNLHQSYHLHFLNKYFLVFS